MVSHFGNEKDILGRWREFCKDLLNSVTNTPLNTRQVHLGEENNMQLKSPCCQNAEDWESYSL